MRRAHQRRQRRQRRRTDVLAIVAVLLVSGKIVAESATFLIGIIVGSLFAFLFKWFSLKE